MDRISRFRIGTARRGLAAACALLLGAGAALAEEPCGLCDDEVVINSALAACFLDGYPQFAEKESGPIVVDLSNCDERSRGVVEPLALPGQAIVEPDVTFMLSRAQLDCLKLKLESQEIPLDPSAKIALDSCG